MNAFVCSVLTCLVRVSAQDAVNIAAGTYIYHGTPAQQFQTMSAWDEAVAAGKKTPSEIMQWVMQYLPEVVAQGLPFDEVRNTDFPHSPSWFTLELPPTSNLAFHVPMAKMCSQPSGTSHKFFLKIYTMNANSKFAVFKTAHQLYGQGMGLLKQAEMAADWCSAHTDFVGLVIEADAVAGHEELILCKSDARHITPSSVAEGTVSISNGKAFLYIPSTSYQLDCSNKFDPKSFKVLGSNAAPSAQALRSHNTRVIV